MSASSQNRHAALASQHVRRHPSMSEDNEGERYVTSHRQSISGTIDLADAMGDSYSRKRTVTQTVLVESISQTLSQTHLSSPTSFQQVDTRLVPNHSALNPGQNQPDDQSLHSPNHIHRQQSFSDARRAMQLAHPTPAPSRKDSSASAIPKPQPPPAFLPPPPPPEEPSSSSDAKNPPEELKSFKSFVKESESKSIDKTPQSRAVSRHASRYVLDERTGERHVRLRRTPHLPHFHSDPISCATMYWSKAPVHGYIPTRGFRASTVTVIDCTAWVFGGMDESGVWNDIYCFDLGSWVTSISSANFDDIFRCTRDARVVASWYPRGKTTTMQGTQCYSR